MEQPTLTKLLYQGKIVVKFFGPTPEKPFRHIYTANEKRKTGVTIYLNKLDKSGALIPWAVGESTNYLIELLNQDKVINADDIFEAAKQHKIKKEKAATIGSEAHKWCSEYILAQQKKGEFPEMPEKPEVVLAVNGFMDWVKKHKVKFSNTEKIVYSRKYDYIGCLDIEAIIGNRRYLIDLKTSNGIYSSSFYQTAAYLKADHEESGLPYKGRWIIRLAKETEKDYIKRMEGKGKTDYPKYQAFEAKYLDDDKENLENDFKAFLACKQLHDVEKIRNPWS